MGCFFLLSLGRCFPLLEEPEVFYRETAERMRLFVLWRASHSARSYIKLELECGWVLFALYHVLPLRILCFTTDGLKG